MSPLRHLAPRTHDRVSDLVKKEPCDVSFITKSIPVLQMIQLCNPNVARKKFELFLEKVEKHVMETHGFNMIIRNVPKVAKMSDTRESVEVKYIHIRDTLRQFGYLTSFHLIRGTVYAKFAEYETCSRAHSLINNMMMGENIIKTELV